MKIEFCMGIFSFIYMLLPKYFVLDGTRAYTTNDKPDTVYFEGRVQPKGYSSSIMLVSIRPLELPHCYSTCLNKQNFSVYKSNLQKCVRRQLCDNAIRTAYAMMSVD